MRSPMLALSVMAMVFTGCSTKSIESTVVEPAAQPVLALTSDRLAAPVLLEVDGESIDAGYPFIGDIDGDRKPDVLMGGENRGRLRIYRSLGGPGEVRLASAQWFDDRVPTGRIPKGWGNTYFRPQLVDFDGDGVPDLLSGSHCCDSFGFHLFRRTGVDSWAPRQHFHVSDESRFVGLFMHRSIVTAADWNGDGVPDLLWRSGGKSGIAVALGPFTSDVALDLAHEIELSPRPTSETEGIIDMTVADWDRDGKPDLLVRLLLDGGKSGIYWYRNLGGPGLKQLAPGKLLVGESVLEAPKPGKRIVYGFSAGDLDQDGKPDLILTQHDLIPPNATGNWRGSTWFFRRE